VTTPEQFAESLRAASASLAEARAQAAVGREPVDSARSLLGDAFEGSTHPAAETAVRLLEEAGDRLDAAIKALDQCNVDLAAYAAEVLGGQGPPSPGGAARGRQERGLTADRVLQNPEAARGRSPADIRRILDEDLNPDQWTRAAVKKGEGTRWFDGKGRSVAIERQPQVGDTLHRGWYLKVANNGRIERVPLAGNPQLRDRP
jgi:hypothetical protein